MSPIPQIIIVGGRPLKGSVTISGSKNAALPLIAATLLTSAKCQISRIPDITDVRHLLTIIEGMGAQASFRGHQVQLITSKLTSHSPNPALVEKLRGSVLVIGPLLARVGKANLRFPGGCNLGDRTLDSHLDGLQQMGVRVQVGKSGYSFSAPKHWAKDRLVIMPEMSVTATENILMLASGLPGRTTIKLASFEPEVVALGQFLQKLGAKITGLGSPTLVVTGKTHLKGANHTNIFDRIEAATFAAAAMLTGGNIVIHGYVAGDLEIVTKKFHSMGATVDVLAANKARVSGPKKLTASHIQTNVFPNFPTDLQPIFGVVATQSHGQSHIMEPMYSNRFVYLQELAKLGAKTKIINSYLAQITGPAKIQGGKANMPDIRGGAALVLAGLVATKPVILSQSQFLHRGYENFIAKLSALGARITEKY